jgi:hypothetical protein
MTLLFIRGFLHEPLDLDSVGITEKMDAWLHGFDPIAVEAGGHDMTGTGRMGVGSHVALVNVCGRINALPEMTS